MASFCLFCCKAISPPDNSGLENIQGKQCIPHFFTLLQRYLGKVQLGGVNGYMGGMKDLELKGCQQCMPILNSFSDAYHKMRCSELHVQWKIHTLTCIMRQASKVPSRIHVLKEGLFGNNDFKNLMKIRNDIIGTCSRGLKKCTPQVRLEPIKTSDGSSPKQKPAEPTSKCDVLLHTWISSFAAILVLLQPTFHNHSMDSGFPSDCGQGLLFETDFFLDDSVPIEIQSKDTSKTRRKCLHISLKSETGVPNEESGDDNESEVSSHNEKNSDVDERIEIGNGAELELSMDGAPCKEEVSYVKEEVMLPVENFKNVDNEITETDPEFGNKLKKATTRTKDWRGTLSLRNHQRGTKNLRKLSLYFCKLCGKGYSSYNGYLAHRKSFSHLYKLKQQSPKPKSGFVNKNVTASGKKSDSKSMETLEKTEEKRYILREKRRSPVKSVDVGSDKEGVSSSSIHDKGSSIESSNSENLSSNSRSKCDSKAVIKTENPEVIKSTIPKRRQQHKCSRPSCSKSFDNAKDLETHKTLHGDFKCQHCKISKGYALDLAKHELKHVKSKKKKNVEHVFFCSRCPYSSSAKGLYLKHFLKVHLRLDFRLHTCPICSASFFGRRSVSIHTRKQHRTTGVDPSEIERCDQCPAYFTNKIYLLHHQRGVHMNIDYVSLKCEICDKSYKNGGSLRAHVANFHGIGRSNENFDFPCDLDNCIKRFKTKHELEWHKLYSAFHIKCRKGSIMESSTSGEKIKCQECGKEYLGINGLKSHMKVHEKGRPTEFKCDQCDKIFKTRHLLKAHQRFHLGPDKWEFMCAICSKKCVDKYVLGQHMRTHSKEKPFVCQVCGEKYAHRHNLRNHVNTKHKDEGVEDVAKKVTRKHFVSRKGKKLTRDFCFTREQCDDGGGDEQQLEESSE